MKADRIGRRPVLAAALAQYGPLPVRLPFAVYLGLLLPALAAVWVMPETVTAPSSAPRWQPQRLGVAQQVRSAFVVAAAAGFAGFAILGLFTSLAPTFVRRELGISNLAVAGLVVFAVFGASSVAQLLLHGLRDRLAIGVGLLALPLGLLLIVFALGQRSLALFVSGAVVAGLGQGLVFMGGLATINRLAPADQRAATLSSYFVVSYLAISLPVIGVGFAAESLGLYDAALVFAIAIGALTLATEATTVTPRSQSTHGPWTPLLGGLARRPQPLARLLTWRKPRIATALPVAIWGRGQVCAAGW